LAELKFQGGDGVLATGGRDLDQARVLFVLKLDINSSGQELQFKDILCLKGQAYPSFSKPLSESKEY
jgi:hypothetical protein